MASEMDGYPGAGSDEIEASDVTIVCAWCGQVLQAGNGGSVSHGLCNTCLPAVIETIAQRLEETPSPAGPGLQGTMHADPATTGEPSRHSVGEPQPDHRHPGA
jgi:hypothetical protein